MKPRVLTTQKILVAVITATAAAGCARPAAEPMPATAESVAVDVPQAQPAAQQAASAAPSAQAARLDLLPAASPTETAPVPTEAASQVQAVSTKSKPVEPARDSKLHSLREELYALDNEEQALAKKAHFRPLCDADGYPVVGNVMRKASGYQPSRFCAAVRGNKGR
jgi:hypothetical protein